jgi:hypothetical protein
MCIPSLVFEMISSSIYFDSRMITRGSMFLWSPTVGGSITDLEEILCPPSKTLRALPWHLALGKTLLSVEFQSVQSG